MTSSAESQNEIQKRVPIADLEPSLETQLTSVTGIVTLIWPYSSSSKTLSVLLVEPDFRLRRHKGQVRIHFTGSSATAVARSGITIGTQISLSLVGVHWAKDESTPRTPGNGVEWELRFGERLALQVCNLWLQVNALPNQISQIERESNEPMLLDIDHPAPSSTPPTLSPTPPRTPSSSHIFAFPELRHTEIWSSPAFLKRSRLSANHLNLQYDPFLEESDSEENRRKRTKFGRGTGQWRFADRTPSPEKEPHSIDGRAIEPTAVSIGEVEVITGLSPKSLSPVQGKSNEGASIEEDQGIGHGHSSEKADEPISVLEGSEEAAGKVLQGTLEAQNESATLLSTSGIGELTAQHADALGSRSVVEEVTESQEPLQSTTGSFDEDEPMASGPTENRHTPSLSKSPTASEASIVDSNESPSAENVDAAASVILFQTPESFESAETPDVLPMRGTSAEPTTSDEDLDDDLSERGTDEEPSVSGSDLPMSSDGGPGSPIVSNRTASEVEGRGLPVTETYRERVSGRLENGHIPVADVASPNELSYFGLDGSAFSRSRSTPSSVSPTKARRESVNNQSDDEDKTRLDTKGTPPLHTQSESTEADAVENTSAIANNAGDKEISPEAGAAKEIKDFIMEQDAEEEGAETQNSEKIAARSSSQSQRKVFDARRRPHEDDDTGGLEKESFLPDVAQGSVQGHASDVHFAPSSGSVEVNPVGLQDDAKAELGVAKEDLSRPLALTQGQNKAMDTSPNIPPRMSNVEIIDLESEGEDENYLEDVEREAEVQPASQEPDLMIAQDTDDGTISVKDEEDITTRSLEAQIDNAPSLKDLDSVNLETTELRSNITEDGGSPSPNSTSLLRLGKAGNGRIAIDAVTDVSNVIDEELHSADDEFPDILDLFTASRKSIIVDEKAAVISQLSQDKTLYSNFTDNERQTKVETLVKEEMNDKLKEDAEKEKLKMRPITDSKLQTQLLTPNATQHTHLLSQESSLSLQTLHEDQDLPTPSLTQSASATNLLPVTPKRRSFVERLKELRSLASKSPRARRSIDTASPWFAPKRSSQIIPNTDSDSVDSEHSTEQIASDDEAHRKDKLSVTPIPPTLRQSPRLHKTLPSTPPPTAPQPTQQPGFRTTLSYFAPLSNLNAHFDTTIDVLATIVSSTTPTRAKTGPKDFHQSFYITDPSSASSKPPITTARIFRPHKSAFPEVAQGDAILLRNFKAQSQSKRLMLLSTDCSAWAVFRKGEEVQIKGPPVEFAAEERGFVRGLWGWWASLSSDKRGSLEAAVPKERGRPKSKELYSDMETATPSPRKTRATMLHELRDGTTYVDESVGEGDKTKEEREASQETSTPSPRRTRRLIRHELRDGTTYTDGKMGGRYGVHELRDGTKYKDEGG